MAVWHECDLYQVYAFTFRHTANSVFLNCAFRRRRERLGSISMAISTPQGQAYNQTRQLYLATDLSIAQSHWTRLRGLLGAKPGDFGNGRGLWIRPCRGVHTLAMRFPIDVVYLDRAGRVVHLEHNLQPWRFSPVRLQASSVLELPSHTLARTETALGDEIEIKINEKG
ncbi:MAG: DUF192 domain-containing protein [Candidatus Sulfotelmatobacter sp.]|jgi:uncharacterized membrane protein (UPF0127 family)